MSDAPSSLVQVLNQNGAAVSDCDPGKYSLAVRIKNAGYLAAGPFTVALTLDGKPAGTTVVKSSLALGAQTTVTFADIDLKTRHKVGITLDSTNSLAEIREDNNSYEMWVNCGNE
jgi:subtilase family serine protease